MALEGGLAVFVKFKFHIYLHLEKDRMERALALLHFQERGKKGVVLFFSIPSITACKVHTLKGPEFPITDDKVALVRKPSVLSSSDPVNLTHAATL